MKVQFKSITENKDALHVLKYVIEDQKGDATIKSTISIILQDVGMTPHERLNTIIPECAKIAEQEYYQR